MEAALEAFGKVLEANIHEQSWRNAATALRNCHVNFYRLDRHAEAAAALTLAGDLAEATDDQEGVSVAIFLRMTESIRIGRFQDADALYTEFRQRKTACHRCVSAGRGRILPVR